MRLTRFRRCIVNENGSAIVLLAIAMTMLLGMAALVTDIGMNYVLQTRLSVAADAAALAGGTKLREGQTQIVQTALAVAQQNGIPAERVTVTVDPDNSGVKVTTKGPIALFFAKIFSIEGGIMAQSAYVVKARPVGMYHVFPIGLDESATFVPFQTYKLFAKMGTSDEVVLGSGNSGALDLGTGGGASTFEEQLRLGYNGLITIGDILPTKSGVKYSAIKSAIEARLNAAEAMNHNCSASTCPAECPRILYVPVYKAIWDGNKVTDVEVVNFAPFWIDAQKKGNRWDIDKEITGVFTEVHKGGYLTEIGDNPYGITSSKLVQ